MQPASQAYKALMKEKFINPLSFMRVTIGVVNQKAQAGVYVPEPEEYTYYSSMTMPFNNYQVQELYATCDQDYTPADGSMYFLPRRRPDVVLNQGIVSEDILGSIEVRFPNRFDIKGLTIEFGKAYPVDFRIESDNNIVETTGNTDGHFVTEEVFEGATFFRFIPIRMINGQSRLRIHQLTMGIGIYFDGEKIRSATKRDHSSPISEELPSIDFSLTVKNEGRVFDVENKKNTIHFMEPGQTVTIDYEQELEDGSIEWMPGASLQLKDWSADDNDMKLTATDCFDGNMDGTFYKGSYHPAGISLFDLATAVFADAGVDSRTYWIDEYLKDVMVNNPMPPVTHKEALQLIANAGRCILYQDRSGNIFLRSSFIPDMAASAEDEADYSKTENILIPGMKDEYASYASNYTKVDGSQYFIADKVPYLNTGYVSKEMSGEDGGFLHNPRIVIQLEASFTCFGMQLNFGGNPPEKVILHTYLFGRDMEEIEIDEISPETIISREFKPFSRLEIEIIKAPPHNRVLLDYVGFGDVTDYHLEYGAELTKTPTGIQLEKVREVQVIQTLYNKSGEEKELINESLSVTPLYNRCVFYFSNPSYDLSVSIVDAQEGQTAHIAESSAYYVVVDVLGVEGDIQLSVTGREYVTTQVKQCRVLNPSGKIEAFENPLVSSQIHAQDLLDWFGNYYRADREYNMDYRGEPRLDINDLMYLENKYIDGMLVRMYDHTLKFNGVFSGSMKVRRYIDVDSA